MKGFIQVSKPTNYNVIFFSVNFMCNKIIHPAFADRLGDKQNVNVTGLSHGCLRYLVL